MFGSKGQRHARLHCLYGSQMKSALSLRKVANTALAPLGIRLERIKADPGLKYEERYGLSSELAGELDLETRKVLNLLNYTKLAATEYSAKAYDSAYHTINLNGRTFHGQRDPGARLNTVPFSFSGASVLDIGCNQGGMLFQISDQIRRGVGIDHDHRMINAANRVRAYKGISHLDFYVFDLEKEDLRLLDNFTSGGKIDIIFLLSVCMWIRNWRDVILRLSQMADNLLFESNGTPQQQEDQTCFLRGIYKTVELIRRSSPDDPGQTKRALYLCRT